MASHLRSTLSHSAAFPLMIQPRSQSRNRIQTIFCCIPFSTCFSSGSLQFNSILFQRINFVCQGGRRYFTPTSVCCMFIQSRQIFVPPTFMHYSSTQKGFLKYPQVRWILDEHRLLSPHMWRVWSHQKDYNNQLHSQCLATVSKRFLATSVEPKKNQGRWLTKIKKQILHGIAWTKQGFHLFGANIKVSSLLLKKKIKGQPLNYREHKLLVRTTHDLIKIIPFSFFILVPFAELLLPVALWLFPGMLPSTFSHDPKSTDQIQRRIKAKQDLAQFFQELVAERTRQVLDSGTSEPLTRKALLLREFQEKLICKAQQTTYDAADRDKKNATSETVETFSVPQEEDAQLFLSVEETLKYAKLFSEEFKLEKMPTRALLVLCEMMGLHPYRIRANIILQLRYHILRLQEEDRHILWEGVENLNTKELRDACRERAMKFYNISDQEMREQMREWLKLSSHRDISPLLLLWSRSITMTHHRLQQIQPVPSNTTEQQRLSEVTDDLLPVIEASSNASSSVKTISETTSHESQDQFLKGKLEQFNEYLKLLQETADQLQAEQNVLNKKKSGKFSYKTENVKEQIVSSPTADNKLQETLIVSQSDDCKKINKKDNVSSESYETLSNYYTLMANEMRFFQRVTELQHKQTQLLLQSLANIIDIYRSEKSSYKPPYTQRKLESFVKYLETTLESFGAEMDKISTIMEQTKNNSSGLNVLGSNVLSKTDKLADTRENKIPIYLARLSCFLLRVIVRMLYALTDIKKRLIYK